MKNRNKNIRITLRSLGYFFSRIGKKGGDGNDVKDNFFSTDCKRSGKKALT